MDDASTVLGRVPLFSELSRDDLELLGSRMKRAEFAAGDVVVREGTRGARVLAFFVIDEGTATVRRSGEHRATLSEGDYFGEIGLVLDVARTATVTAETDLRCYALSAWDFRSLLDEHLSIEVALARALEQRLSH